jgi:beta-galactosidase
MKIKYEAVRKTVLLMLLLAAGGSGWAVRVDTLINDQWRFSYFGSNDGAGTEAVSFDDSSWSIVNLPHTWNALDGQDGGSNYARGFGWYRKHLTVGSEYAGKRVYLFFESVTKKTDVYCNGVFVGKHLGAYAAFCYDITDQIHFGSDNLIAVRADNANTSPVNPLNIIPRSGDFNQWGGICRSVHLITANPVHITLLDYASPGVYLTPANVSQSSADLEVKTLVRNADASSQLVTVRAKIYDAANTLLDTLQTDQTVAGGTTQTFVQNTAISNPHLWNGRADPYLYKVIIEVEIDGTVVDSIEQPLGLRYYSVDPDMGFFLNGQYLDLHGVAMHEDRTNKGRAISDADREQDMALMLEMGCTWIRPSHYQHAEKFYDLADENGIVLSTEIPIVDGIEFSTAFVDNCKDQLRELIRQNYNHPSVFFWLLYNELTTSGSETVIQQLHDLARAEDPTRLTACAHNNTSDTAAWSYISDVLGYNRYMGWYGGSPEGFAPWADSIHALRPADEIGIMEYGAGANTAQHETPPAYPGPTSSWHPEEYQSYYHEVYWKAMKARPFLWCKTIWNGFDFAVDSRNEGSQPGLNDKGMVTRDRTIKKDAFYWYKANWTTEPMVYIASRRFTPRADECPPYVRVYSNCDSVELFVNGISMGTKTAADRIFMWDAGIALQAGDNDLTAIGISGENSCRDSCIWNFIVTGNPDDCAYRRSIGCYYAADISGPAGQPDCSIDNYDFAQIAAQWQDEYRETVTPTDPGTANLVAYWPLDGNYSDASGNGHNASATGGTLSFVNPGHSGQSVDFDGASGLNCADSSGINLTSGATISAWIKSSNETDSWACVVAKGVTAWRLIRNEVGSTICFHFNPAGGGTEFQANGSTPVLDGRWHHLMGVYDGSQIRLYVDGQLDASTSTGGAALRTSTDPVYIGSRIGRLSDRSWNGQIDEVRIYDRALNESEILWLSEREPYNQIPNPPRPTDLVLDGRIDLDDLVIFIHQWLLCYDPQNPSCLF